MLQEAPNKREVLLIIIEIIIMYNEDYEHESLRI